MNDDIRVLISRDGQKKIVCYKYMEECFHNEGFVTLQNSNTNLFYKLFNFKILKKIKNLFLLILKYKFYFKNPKHSKIVIFDCETTANIEKVLPNKNYVILSTRIKKINKIYLSWKILADEDGNPYIDSTFPVSNEAGVKLDPEMSIEYFVRGLVANSISPASF